ncbi:hypothetical protein GGS21DRAFT_469065 [Xylaria nigripes]|nr:hypothetical protein GGS21DRAFT_469065 [Xylaria nigripes]
MFRPGEILQRALVITIAFALYTKYHGTSLVEKQHGSLNDVTCGADAPCDENDFHNNSSMQLVSLATTLELYVACEVLTLFIRPFWRLSTHKQGSGRFFRDVAVCWSLAYVLFATYWIFGHQSSRA